MTASRRADRPGAEYVLKHGATDRVLLSGTGGGSGQMLLALARFGGQPAVVLGQQRIGMVATSGAARGPTRHGGWPPTCAYRWCR